MEALKDGASRLAPERNCWKTAFAAAETTLGTMAEKKAARVNDRLKHTQGEERRVGRRRQFGCYTS